MFRDLIFYPLAVFIVGGIVALAMSVGGAPPLSDEDIIRQGWQMSGADLRTLTISPGSTGVYSSSDGGYIRLSQQVPLGVEPPSIGVFATLGPAHERVFAGRKLRITFKARSVRNNPLRVFQAAYVPVEAAPSGWTNFEMGLDWDFYSFDYRPPVLEQDPKVDLIAVFPGRWGRNQQMDLAAITVSVIPDAPD
jgi:hypothetical protein